MRGVVDDLTSAAPLALQLPAVLQDDDFAQRFVSAFDVALAPILATLDDLPAYVDPHLAPDDFVEWLSGWVGVEFAGGWDLPTRRAVVAGAVAGYRRDATVGGIRAAVQRATGATEEDVTVTDSGGARWSATPGAPLPGDTGASLHVRVVVDGEPADGLAVLQRRVERLVAAMKPAHVVATVEVSSR